MADEWQAAAFGSRHMHNRVQNKSSRKNRPFDVHKTFGSYACKCAAWKTRCSNDGDEKDITLELYRLSPNGEGVLGKICFPRALDAAVILSGSRASLNKTVQGAELKPDEEDKIDESEEGGEEDECGNDEDDIGGSEDDVKFEEEPARFRKFEKNSFRQPKFWFRWNGVTEGPEVVTSGLGYMVFSGNECRNFKGTITCEQLGWKDTAFGGRKIFGRGSSDIPIGWNGHLV